MAQFQPDAPIEIPPAAPKPASSLALWLLVLTLTFLFLALFLVSATIREGTAPLANELQSIQSTLSSTAQPGSVERDLSTALADSMQQINVLQPVYSDLYGDYVNWTGVMQVISSYDYAQMRITRILQTEHQVTLNGEAPNENITMDYVTQLRNSGYFSSVTLQTLNLVAPTNAPGVTPVAPVGTFAQFIIVTELRSAGQ